MNIRTLFKKKETEKRDLNYVQNPVTVFGFSISDKLVSPTALSAFYRALTLISETLAGLKFSVKLTNDNTSNLENHPVNNIFKNRTDSNITFFELIRQLV